MDDPTPLESNASPDPDNNENARKYWRANKILIAILLSIWFVVGLLLSIILVDAPFMQFNIGNLPFGFWLAQQGAIYVFVILIFVYAIFMDRLDKKHHLENGDQ